jgi:two-component system, NarL family, sensor kinase
VRYRVKTRYLLLGSKIVEKREVFLTYYLLNLYTSGKMFCSMKKISLIFALFCCNLSLQSQVLMNKDSLLKLLPTLKEDSLAVETYINLGQQYESSQPELAKHYYHKAGAISEKINYSTGILKFINNYTFVLNLQARYDSSLQMNLKAVEVARRIKDTLNLGKALFNTGTSYRSLAQFEDAVLYYEEGKKIFASIGNADIEARCNDILQLLYYGMGEYDKAIEYGQNAVAYFRKTDDKIWLGTSLSNLGISYSKKQNYTKALVLLNEALSIGKEIGNTEMEAAQMLNIGDCYLNTNDFPKLKFYYSQALELYTQLDSKENMAIALRGMALYYLFEKSFNQAKAFAEKSLLILNNENLLSQRQKTLETLSNIHFALHDITAAENYARLASKIGDSILNETVRKNTLDLEKKYEFQKKQAQIYKLETENKIQRFSIRQKKVINYILTGSAIALLIILLLSYRTYSQKQKIQQQRISELETERQLNATEAVLKGEEQERIRLAKDLHDGLGGMLSGVKFSMNSMKGNLVLTPENYQAFERSMDMLDSSINEMRRVAHNMMPEALVRFGLDTALKDFCNDINQSGALKISYQSIGFEGILIDQTIAITLYRIVQELLNNSMKHANASSAIVQVTNSNNLLSITVEDDGKGFDINTLKENKGIGWTNIQNRVEFLKGKLDIKTKEGEGTSVQIELNI